MREMLNGLSRYIEYDLRQDLFVHLTRLDDAYFARMRTGDLMARLTNDLSAVRMAAGPATLAVRPQRLRLVDAAQGVLPGVVKRASYLGSRIEYVVVTAWGELLVFDVEARTARRREDAVGVAFDRDAVIVLKR